VLILAAVIDCKLCGYCIKIGWSLLFNCRVLYNLGIFQCFAVFVFDIHFITRRCLVALVCKFSACANQLLLLILNCVQCVVWYKVNLFIMSDVI